MADCAEGEVAGEVTRGGKGVKIGQEFTSGVGSAVAFVGGLVGFWLVFVDFLSIFGRFWLVFGWKNVGKWGRNGWKNVGIGG